MLTIAYYFLQVVLCSGVMMGYYLLVLRNKRFHQYNRFYLLAIALLSWIVPLVKISWSQPIVATTAEPQVMPQVMQFLSVVADNNSQIEQTITRKGFEWSWDTLASTIYLGVAAILLFGMVRAFTRLYQLLKNHSCKNIDDVYLVITHAKGTPFSFFRYIFWNEEIDLRTEAGKQILQHELTHVRQKHSFDKLFIQVMLIGGWFNPFFWLLRKEMDMIHEFIADKRAVENGDTASLAQMLLTAAYPQQQFALTHPFFFSPIKRRLQMLANNKNPRFSYIRRLIVLPLLALVTILFAFRNKEQRGGATLSVASVVENVVDAISTKISRTSSPIEPIYNNAMLNRTYTVVIDAGHGGTDKGVTGADGTPESAITLQLAKAIKELNTNNNINIILTRNEDVFTPVVKTADAANELHPDLFVSLHCNEQAVIKNSKENFPSTGIQLFIPSKTGVDYNGSETLANMLVNALKGLNEKMIGISTRGKRIHLLETVQSPAVMLEAGFMTNRKDLEKLKDAAYQKQMAGSILQGINNYLRLTSNYSRVQTLLLDTIPATIQPLIGDKWNTDKAQRPWNRFVTDALIIIDGEKTDYNTFASFDAGKIERVDVLKNESAIAKYGAEGKMGVILITTRQGSWSAKNGVGETANDNSGKGNGANITNINTSIRPGPANTFLITDSLGDVLWQTPKTGNRSDTAKPPTSFSFNTHAISTPGVDILIEPNTTAVTTISVKSAELDDPVIAKPQGDYPEWAIYVAWISEPGKVKVRFANYTDKAITVRGDQYKIVTGKFPETVSKDAVGMAPLPSSATPIEVVGRMRKGMLLDETGKIKADAVSHNPTAAYKPMAIGNEDDDLMPPRTLVGYKLGVDAQGVKNPLADFPGGKIAWTKYLERNLARDIVKKNGGPPGKYTVTVSFTVDNTGAISNVKADNDPGYGSKEEAIRVIAKGPGWKPAVDNDGKNISSDQKQRITFLVGPELSSAPSLASTESMRSPVIPPSFPGGLGAWAKYLERVIDKDAAAKKGAPAGKYKVVVHFMVSELGYISNVEADNDPGYGMKEQAVAVIAKGPRWKPAIREARNIPVLHTVTITFVVNDNKTVLNDPKPFDRKHFDDELEKQKQNNTKSYFVIDNNSCVAFSNGYLSFDEVTDIIFMNGERITPEELNIKYNRNELINGASNPQVNKKFGKSVFILSNKRYKDADLVAMILNKN